MTDYNGNVIDSCSDCGKRGPMWSGMPYKCKGCSDKMSKSNDIFEEVWSSINKGKKGSKPDYKFTGLPCDECGESLNTHEPHLKSPSGGYESGVCDKCKSMKKSEDASDL